MFTLIIEFLIYTNVLYSKSSWVNSLYWLIFLRFQKAFVEFLIFVICNFEADVGLSFEKTKSNATYSDLK